MSENYDAFISYRHAEFDDFVADTVQRELERFRLPSRISKRHAGEKKRRIERVFMDKNELALASDLSEAIYDALKSSEYLIVICTPRVLESKWCKKEIEFFIKEHGADHVLAVLAEGEPADAFPEELTHRTVTTVGPDGGSITESIEVEPLAADVRGESRKEIKKKIKSEILRLAAVMFNCSYEDLRQRHREEKLRKNITIAFALMAVFALFGTYALVQAALIREQSKELEKQYNENLIRTAQLYAQQAEQYIGEGEVQAALGVNLNAVYQDENLPQEAKDCIACSLADTLGIYNNGSEMKPYASLSVTANTVDMQLSENGKYVLASDIGSRIYIWRLDNFKIAYEIEDYAYDSTMEGLVTVCGDSVIYVRDDAAYIVNMQECYVVAQIECDAGACVYYVDEESFALCMSDGISIISSITGETICSVTGDDYSFGNIKGCYIDESHAGMFIVCYIDGVLHVISTGKNDLTVIGDACLSGYDAYESCAFGGNLYLAGNISGETFENYSVRKISFGTDEAPEVLGVNEYVDSFFETGDYIVISTDSRLYFMDTETDEIKNDYRLSEYVRNVFKNDGSIYIYYSNGVCETANTENYNFRENSNYRLPEGYYSHIYVVDDRVITYKSLCSYVTVYSSDVSPYLEKTDKDAGEFNNFFNEKSFEIYEYTTPDGKYRAVREDERIAVYKEGALIGEVSIESDDKIYFALSDDGKYYFSKDYSERVAVYLTDGMKYLYGTELLTDGAAYCDMGNYYALFGYDVGYIYSKLTDTMVAKVYGFAGYDEKENILYIYDANDSITIYSVPFYSLDELVAFAQDKVY